MKVLAEYVMAGPKQASIFCLGFGFVPLVGPWFAVAGLALVVLHLGLSQAIKVLPWAVLPGIAWLALGDPSYLLLVLSVFLAAIVLEASRSLALAILVAVILNIPGFLLVHDIMSPGLEKFAGVIGGAMEASDKVDVEKLSEASIGKEGVALDKNSSLENNLEEMFLMLANIMFAWVTALSASLVLLLARWWQSLLYKPGAFQGEFHALRLTWGQMIIIFAGMVFLSQGLNAVTENNLGLVVAPMLSIPILLSGIALVHGLVAIAGVSAHWLGMFYVAFVIVGHLIYLPVMVAAMLDVAMDFRSRFRRSKASDEEE